MVSLCIRTTDHGLMFKELEFILFFLLTCIRARKISLPGNGPTRFKYILYISLIWKNSALLRVFFTVFFLWKRNENTKLLHWEQPITILPTLQAREHFTPVNQQEDLDFGCPKHFLLSRWDLKGNTMDWITSVLQIVHCGVRGLLYLLMRAWYGTR